MIKDRDIIIAGLNKEICFHEEMLLANTDGVSKDYKNGRLDGLKTALDMVEQLTS
jgi:hypothetical protein